MEIPALDIMRDFVSWQQETIVTCFTTTASLQSLCCWQFYKACSQSEKSSIKNTLHGRTPCFQSKYSWSYLMAQHILIIHFLQYCMTYPYMISLFFTLRALAVTLNLSHRLYLSQINWWPNRKNILKTAKLVLKIQSEPKQVIKFQVATPGAKYL